MILLFVSFKFNIFVEYFEAEVALYDDKTGAGGGEGGVH